MKHLSPLKTIKLFCVDCGGGNRKEARDCFISDCLLFPFRLGKNPYSKKRKGNPHANFGRKTPILNSEVK